MDISISTTLNQLKGQLEGLSARRIDSITAAALTATAAESRKMFRSEAIRTLDRPTNYTLNSTYINRATASKLTSEVGFKSSEGRLGPGKYLGSVVSGIDRNDKGLEVALKAFGVMPLSWRALPGPGARIDANGNMSRAQVKEIIEAMRSYKALGYQAASQVQTTKRGNVKKQNQYFAVAPGGRLGPGIYVRQGSGNRKISRVINFVESVSYKKIFEIDTIVGDVINARFGSLFAFYMSKSIQRKNASALVVGTQTDLFT
jgi:hypothetical protein